MTYKKATNNDWGIGHLRKLILHYPKPLVGGEVPNEPEFDSYRCRSFINMEIDATKEMF